MPDARQYIRISASTSPAALAETTHQHAAQENMKEEKAR
jgi:uncharacterized protein YqfB (UPF0267 family)